MTDLRSRYSADSLACGTEIPLRAVEGFFHKNHLSGPATTADQTSLDARAFLRNLYYYGSLPYRHWWNSRQAAAGRAPVMVLFYHRIADDRATPWTMSNAMFRRQVRWLRRHFDMVSLSEAQHRIQSGVNHLPSVSITFDDGYAENCDAALPLLVRQQIPCTYFVSSKFVLEGLPFPHDVACSRPLRPNTLAQLRELTAAGVEIGAHTRTHCNLAQVFAADRLHGEIITARDELQDALDCRIRYFAFPFGRHANLSREAFWLAREAGYEAVCSAYGGFNFPGDDPFHLQRIHGDDNMTQFKNWLTLDPRKRRGVKRFEYQESRDCSAPLVRS